MMGVNRTPPPTPARTARIPITNVTANNKTGQTHQGVPVVPAAEFAVEPMVAVAADSTGATDPHRKEILAVRISIINSLPYQWFKIRAVF